MSMEPWSYYVQSGGMDEEWRIYKADLMTSELWHLVDSSNVPCLVDVID